MLIHLSENYVVSINYSKNSTRSKLFQGPNIGAKGILECYLYLCTPKISQDFPTNSILSYISQTKDSSVTHKENNVETRKVEDIEEDSLDLMSSPSPSVEIQIIGRKVYWR